MIGEIQAYGRFPASEPSTLPIDGTLEIEPHTYPGGEPLFEHGRGFHCFRLLVRPSSIQSLMAALFFIDALHARGHDERTIDLILPYVPGARQDRLNDEGDFLFTAKSVAKEINARQFR